MLIGSVLIAVGMLFALVGAIGAVLWIDQIGRVLRVERLPRFAGGSGSRRVPGLVVAEGRAGAGPRGILRAPYTGRAGVWWHIQVHRVDHVGRTTRRFTVLDVETGRFVLVLEGGAGGGEGVHVEGCLARPFPTGFDFGVPDDLESAARVEVEACPREGGPALDRLVDAGLLDDRSVRPRRETVGFEVHEAVIDADLAVTAAARMHWDGDGLELRRTRRAPSFLVLGTIDQTLERLRRGRQESAAAIGAAFVVATAALAAGLALRFLVG